LSASIERSEQIELAVTQAVSAKHRGCLSIQVFRQPEKAREYRHGRYVSIRRYLPPLREYKIDVVALPS